MIPTCSEIQPTVLAAPKRKLIDYEKCRSNDFATTQPQGHVTVDFTARKETFGMPTYYTLDKKFEESFHSRYFVEDYSNNKKTRNNKIDKRKRKSFKKGGEKVEKYQVDFMFKVKRNHMLHKSSSVPDFSSRSYTNLISKRKATRRRHSGGGIDSRRISDNYKDISSTATFRPSIIKQILRQKRRSTLSHPCAELKQQQNTGAKVPNSIQHRRHSIN